MFKFKSESIDKMFINEFLGYCFFFFPINLTKIFPT